MTYQVDRRYTNQVINIPIMTMAQERIVVKVKHPRKPHTFYFETAPLITGKDMFVIKIPKMPESVLVRVYNARNGNLDFDNSFKVGKITVGPIRLGFAINKIMDDNVSRFAQFSDWFSENAAILSDRNSVYVSDDGKFRIDYKDVIRDDNGNELRTPARVNSKTGVIEIAKRYYMLLTVPGRRWTNWHEFSHVWKNENASNEFEADRNATIIYLGTGNPTVEAYNGAYRIFKNSPSNLNKQRYDELNRFIRNFNKIMGKQISQNSSAKS